MRRWKGDSARLSRDAVGCFGGAELFMALTVIDTVSCLLSLYVICGRLEMDEKLGAATRSPKPQVPTVNRAKPAASGYQCKCITI